MDASFLTWSGSGQVIFWDMDGCVKANVQVPFDMAEFDTYGDLCNQLVCVQAIRNGKLIIVGDRLGVLKIIDVDTNEMVLDTKAHSLHCLNVSVHENFSKMIMATCGKDRAVQLFYRK